MPNDLLNGEPPSGFMDLIGYRLVAWRPDEAVIELAIEPKHLNRAGVVHGGVLTTLLDTACGFSATFCPHPDRVRRVVTLSLTTSYVGQASRGIVRATARKRAGGTRIVFCHGEVTDDQGQLLATAEGTFRYRTGSESPDGVPLTPEFS